MSSPFISIQSVSKHFGTKKALDNVSWQVDRGRISGLLGPNGAGKTTLFRLIMGILKSTEGGIAIDDLDSFDDRIAVKRLVGFLPDEPVFYSYLSGWDVLKLSAGMHGFDPDEVMAKQAELITRLDMDEALDRYAEDYSRGMKKKLGLLLALVHDPQLLILDEPTNGLDVESTRLLFELMREKANEGITIVFSTHLMDQVERLCQDIAIIKSGKVVACGELGEVCGSEKLEEVFVRLTQK